MKKLDCSICTRCSRIVDMPVEMTSKQKQTKMHFCDDRCLLTFFKGRKYYARKKILQSDAFAKRINFFEKV
jgi:hypothetical protein